MSPYSVGRDGPELKRDENGQVAEVRLPSKLSTAMSFLTVIGSVFLGVTLGGTFSQLIGNRFLIRETWMVSGWMHCLPTGVVMVPMVADVALGSSLRSNLESKGKYGELDVVVFFNRGPPVVGTKETLVDIRWHSVFCVGKAEPKLVTIVVCCCCGFAECYCWVSRLLAMVTHVFERHSINHIIGSKGLCVCFHRNTFPLLPPLPAPRVPLAPQYPGSVADGSIDTAAVRYMVFLTAMWMWTRA